MTSKNSILNTEDMVYLSWKKPTAWGCFWLALFVLSGCQPQRETEPKVKTRLNWFSMRIYGQGWKPYQPPEDTCGNNFSSTYGWLGDKPTFTFYARDAAKEGEGNFLEIRMINVSEPGVYVLDGSRAEWFSSYAMSGIRSQPGSEPRIYTSDPRRSPFTVTIEEITQVPNSVVPGTRGRFSGILYSEENLRDSILITDGVFRFKKMGADHCGFE